MRKNSFNTEHPQVPFDTIKGHRVGVDEGVLDLLTELKRLGVETHFSCQGPDMYGRAYVMGTGKTMKPLLTRMMRMYYFGGYTPRQKALVREFIKGARSVEFSHFKGKGTYVKPTRMTREHVLGFGDMECSDYRTKLLYSNAYGFRISVRWPPECTYDLTQLLKAL